MALTLTLWVDAEIVEQRLGSLEALALARFEFGNCRAGFGIRHHHLERQALFIGDPPQQHADRVGHRQPHRGERGAGRSLGVGIDAGADNV